MRLLRIAAVASGLLTACTPNGLDGRLQVALVGDSITLGSISDPAIPPERPAAEKLCFDELCFAALVERHLDELGVSTARVAAGGATTRDFDPNDFRTEDTHYRQAGRELFSFVPAANVVVVLLGTNDAVGFFEGAVPVPPDEYAGHLYDIALTLTRRGVEDVVLLTPPIPAAWRPPHPAAVQLEAYAERVRRLAAMLPSIHLVDLARLYPRDEWYGDAIHPTIDGHRRIAEEVVAKLLEPQVGLRPALRGRREPGRVRLHARPWKPLRRPLLSLATPDPGFAER